MILKVPAGTVVKDAETGKVILDMANRHGTSSAFKRWSWWKG